MRKMTKIDDFQRANAFFVSERNALPREGELRSATNRSATIRLYEDITAASALCKELTTSATAVAARKNAVGSFSNHGIAGNIIRDVLAPITSLPSNSGSREHLWRDILTFFAQDATFYEDHHYHRELTALRNENGTQWWGTEALQVDAAIKYITQIIEIRALVERICHNIIQPTDEPASTAGFFRKKHYAGFSWTRWREEHVTL